MLKKALDEVWNHGYCRNPSERTQWDYLPWSGLVKCLNDVLAFWKADYK